MVTLNILRLSSLIRVLFLMFQMQSLMTVKTIRKITVLEMYLSQAQKTSGLLVLKRLLDILLRKDLMSEKDLMKIIGNLQQMMKEKQLR